MAYMYSVVCEDKEIVLDMAKFDNADVIPWGDSKDGYIFFSFNEPTEFRWQAFGVPFRIDHVIKIERTQARELLGKNEHRIIYRHPTTDFPVLLKPEPHLLLVETAEAVPYPPPETVPPGPLTTALNEFLAGRR